MSHSIGASLPRSRNGSSYYVNLAPYTAYFSRSTPAYFDSIMLVESTPQWSMGWLTAYWLDIAQLSAQPGRAAWATPCLWPTGHIDLPGTGGSPRTADCIP